MNLWLGLGVASLAAAALLGLRVWVTGTLHWAFLLWNLLLAWVPAALEPLTRALWRRARQKQGLTRGLTRAAALLSGGAWIVFFPNAPYLLTDFIHIQSVRYREGPGGTGGFSSAFLPWFDLSLLIFIVLVGLWAGFASLSRVQDGFKAKLGETAGLGLTFGLLSLSALGVYLGRFLRWNSWDIALDPVSVASQSLEHFGPEAWAFIGLFTALTTGLYALFRLLSRKSRPA